jgi:hypothetical protein
MLNYTGKVFLSIKCTIILNDYATLLVIATLGGMVQIKRLLFVSKHPSRVGIIAA